MSDLRLAAVTKSYGDDTALSSVDLHCADGALLVVFGPSGAGKSTLLKLVAGIEDPSEGRVWIAGHDVTAEPPQRRDIAMAFESYALYPHLSVWRNLEFPLRAPGRGLDANVRAERIREVAALLDITELLERHPNQLSGGQRQRVSLGRALVRDANATLLDEPIAHLDARLCNALRGGVRQRVSLARALVRRPSVFLLDEPISHLEAELRNEMRIELKRVHGANESTTTYVTHDQLEALTMADRVAIMHQGLLQQVGTPEDVYRRPANRFVATFVGEPPMNIVRARVSGGRVAIGDYALEGLPTAMMAAIEASADAAGGAVDVGVRPDDIRLGGLGAPGIAGHIRIREALGDTTLLAVDTEGDRLRLRSGGGLSAREGERVRLHPRADRIHFFDAATGVAVGQSAGTGAD